MAQRSKCAKRASGVVGHVAAAAFAVLLAAAWCGPVQSAETSMSAPKVVEVDKAIHLRLDAPAKTVFVANPDIADVQVANSLDVLIYGKKAGFTTVYAIAENGTTTSYAITIERQVVEIAAALQQEFPGAHIKVASAPNGLMISGSVDSPSEATNLKAAAQQYLGEKDSLIFDVAVDAATQVNLRVRVAQVSRQVAKNFGFNWGAIFNNSQIAVGLLVGRTPTAAFGNFLPSPTGNDSLGFGYRSGGGSVNVSSLIDALQNEGLITVLAEPNLTAVSGQTANFLAGGEFPVPVSQGLQQVTIEWKRFGVSIDFTPTVLDDNRLSIKVRPEVSELTQVGAVTVNNIQIPGLAVRRADTTVELASGQSFAIAGLFQNNVSTNIQRVPWLGDVPVLGTLFRSDSFQRNESELVIIVTPYLVKPADRTSDLQLPTDGIVFASDIEQQLLGRLTARTAVPTAAQGPVPHLSGDAGFDWEK
jgi:pilus assembly protein CpaC